MKIVQSKKVQVGLMLTATVSGQTDGKSKLRSRNYYQLFIIITIIFAIIITTRSKPAYGLGWAGPWGQNTVQAVTFLGLLHVLLCTFGAQLRLGSVVQIFGTSKKG